MFWKVVHVFQFARYSSLPEFSSAEVKFFQLLLRCKFNHISPKTSPLYYFKRYCRNVWWHAAAFRPWEATLSRRSCSTCRHRIGLLFGRIYLVSYISNFMCICTLLAPVSKYLIVLIAVCNTCERAIFEPSWNGYFTGYITFWTCTFWRRNVICLFENIVSLLLFIFLSVSVQLFLCNDVEFLYFPVCKAGILNPVACKMVWPMARCFFANDQQGAQKEMDEVIARRKR